MHRFRLLLCVLCACLRLAPAQPSAVLSMTLSSYGIQDVATYSFRITIQGDGTNSLVIPAGSAIILSFPAPYPPAPAISNPCTLVSWPVASGSLACTLSFNVLTITNAFANDYTIAPDTFDQLSFAVESITNPTYAQQINNPPISGRFSYSFTNLLAFSPTSFITIQGGVLGVGISASPTTTDSTSTLTISITPSHPIPVGGCLKITLEKLYTTSVYTVSLISQAPLCQAGSNASASLFCTYITSSSSIVVTVANIFTVASSSPFVFTLFPFNNPPTTQPFGSFTFLTSSLISNGLTIDSSTNNRISGITPALVQNPTATFSSTLIGSVIEMNITATITNAIASTDIIAISTPEQISCSGVTAVSVAGNLGGSLAVINSTSFQFRNMPWYNTYPITIIISGLTLPSYAASISSPFVMLVYRNSFLVCKMNASFNINLSPGSLTGTLASSSEQAGVASDFTFSLNFEHPIASSSQITFYFSPAYFSINTNMSCISSGSTTCAASSSSNLVTVSSATMVTTTSLLITLLNVTNPSAVGNFTPIIVTTYIRISSTFYMLDAANNFAYFEVIARPMSYNHLTFTTTSEKVYDLATFTFIIQNNNYLPPNSYIWLMFPREFTLSSVTCDSICISGEYNGSNGVQFQQLGPFQARTVSTFIVRNIINPISTKPTSTFSVYIFNSQKNLLEYLSAGRIFQAKTPSLLTISLSSSPLQNSFTGWFNVSYSPIYQISDPVCLLLTVPNSLTCPSCLSSPYNSTYTQMVFSNQVMSSGKYTLNLASFTFFYSFQPISLHAAVMSNDLLYNYANGTFSLTNQIASFPSFIYAFTNYQLKTQTDLIISNFTSATILQRVSSIKITISSDFDTSKVSCLSQGYICAINSGVVTLSITNIANLTTISINDIITPQSSPSTFISLSTYSSTGHLIDQSSTIFWQSACNLPCKTCTSVATRCQSCYSDLILSQSRVIYFPLNSTCVSDCGDKYFRNYSTNVCMSCSSACYNCYNYSYCTSCPAGQYLLSSETTCYTSCPTGFFQKNLNCIACTSSLNCYTCTNQLTCASCYPIFLFQSQCRPSCPPLTTVQNSINFTCDPCPTNCSTCTLINDTVSCLSCSSGLLDNGACVQSCITYGYVPNNLICSQCDSTCKTCQGSPNFCLSCWNASSHPYFLKNKCYQTCPDTYYNDSPTGLCLPCTAPCQTCYNYSSTACISCLSPSSLYETTCKSTCPSKYYANGAICSSCISPCLTCLTAQLCYTCQQNYTLFASNYTCLSKCPDGYVSINQTCIPCSSNCFTCIAVTYCSNCHNNSYILNGYCYDPCPTGFYSDSSSKSCKNCPSQCTACSSPTFCSACASGYYKSNNTCISLCASNQISINSICTNCSSSCATCQGNINNCTACPSNYLFAPSSNSCYLQCPASLYYYPSSRTCITSCPSPSYVISNISTNASTCMSCPILCTSCISDTQCGGCISGTYSYQNFCYPNCPTDALYSFDFKCQSCNVVDCQSCSGTSCTICSSGLFLIGDNLCITSCSSLQVYNPTNKTCDTIVTDTTTSNSSSGTTISLPSNSTVNLNFIPMPFLMLFIIITIVVLLLHLNVKLAALPTLLGIIGPLFSVDIFTIIIISYFTSILQSILPSLAIYVLIAALVLTACLSTICIKLRYRLTYCQKSFILALAALHHDAMALLTANINYYNSYFIEQHKYFWRRYRLICKIGLFLFFPIFFSGVALVFSITDRSNYIFYAGIQLCIMAFLQLLLTLAWIWLPVQSPPQKSISIPSALSEQSTQQVSDGHESVNNQEQSYHNQKDSSMERLNSKSSKPSKPEEPVQEVKIRNSQIKSEGDQLQQQSNQSNGRVKSNYQFNQITGVVKVDANDIKRALEKGLFRRSQEQILKQIKEVEEYSKIDDAQKLNNYLKQQEVINIFENFNDNQEQEDSPISPKLQPVENQTKAQIKNEVKTPTENAVLQAPVAKKIGSEGSMAMCDEPLLVKEQDFHHNIIFEENQEDNRTYFEGESESSQQKYSHHAYQLEKTPSLGSIVYKDTNKIIVSSPKISPRLISPDFDSNRKESNIIIEDFQDSFKQDNFNIFNTGNSRIKPKFSKQLSKIEPQKEVIHADFEQIISVSDGGSLLIEENDYTQHDSSRKIVNKRINEDIHDHDNGLFRPSQILRQASKHYQPQVERNQAPKNVVQKPIPRFASQLSKKR